MSTCVAPPPDEKGGSMTTNKENKLYTAYKFYQTQTGDRWDTLAYKFYGDVFKQTPIIEANPNVPLTPILEQGITLLIPILDTKTNKENLPIWKQ